MRADGGECLGCLRTMKKVSSMKKGGYSHVYR